MSPSEQQSHGLGDGSSEPGESVTIAARVFGNYVLAPAAGQPHETPAGSALHGAALLILADEADQKIHLRTGYAAHVRRDPVLGARKDIGDESVSGHEDTRLQMKVDSGKLETKGTDMTQELHCSACGAAIPQGSLFCAGCGLPLIAQAVPTVHATGPRFSFGAIALLSIVGFVLFCWLASNIEHRSAAAHAASIAAQLGAGGALSTPEAFQSRCGKAAATKATAAGTQLFYSANQIVVTFPPQGAVQFAMRTDMQDASGHSETYDRPEEIGYAMKYIPCAQ